MPQYNDILINNHLKFDEENFDELAKFVKFVKFFPTRTLHCTVTHYPINEHVPIDERHQVIKIAIIVAARYRLRSGLVADLARLLMAFIEAIAS